MARKTYTEEGMKELMQLKVSDTVDSDIIRAITGKDPWDQPDDILLLQADDVCSSETIGNLRLFETFTRLSRDDAWVYMGLCEKESPVNRSPAEAHRVFICSPYSVDPEWCIRFAKAACREAFSNGCLPIAPHLYFTQFLQDGDGYEREFGIAAGHELMKECDAILVYAVNGYISAGMRADIEFAINRLAMQPTMIRMTKEEAEEYMEEYLDGLKIQWTNPAEE